MPSLAYLGCSTGVSLRVTVILIAVACAAQGTAANGPCTSNTHAFRCVHIVKQSHGNVHTQIKPQSVFTPSQALVQLTLC